MAKKEKTTEHHTELLIKKGRHEETNQWGGVSGRSYKKRCFFFNFLVLVFSIPPPPVGVSNMNTEWGVRVFCLTCTPGSCPI